jgi:hypothetical protein
MAEYGTSRRYLLARMRQEGLHALAAAVEAGRVSAFAAAIELGWQKPPVRTGTGSPNQAKRRRMQIRALIREGLFDAPTSR